MIFYADNTFEPSNKNPFNNHMPYDDKWIMLKLIDEANFKLFTGGGNDGIFSLIITKKTCDWQYRIFDFIQYGEYHKTNMIIAVKQDDLTAAKALYNGHSYKDKFLRHYEEKILMHSTTTECYRAIFTDGCLKSWKVLNWVQRTAENMPIGALLGDPINYSNYIMFSHGGKSAERVVSSRQKGYIEMDLDVPYVAGARFYLDCEKIANDGLLVRDGAHLKVENTLPLEKYLLWVATPEALGISENTTPRIFAEKADKTFSEMFGVLLSEDTSS